MKIRIVSILVIFLLLGVSVNNGVSAVDKGIALTLKVAGDAQIKKAGTDKKVPLKFGTRLDDGDWIKTGADGFVSLIFSDDKSMLKLRPSTEITISGKRDSQSNISKRISLEVGQLLAKVEQQRGTLEIATPTSVASVKGTEFWVVVYEDGTTEVFTLGGLVQLLNRFTGNISEVKPGEVGQSDPDGGVNVNPADPNRVPNDPDQGDDGNDAKTIEIDVKDDPAGRKRTIRLNYE